MPLYSATFEWKADDEICSGLYVAFVTNNIFKVRVRLASSLAPRTADARARDRPVRESRLVD